MVYNLEQDEQEVLLNYVDLLDEGDVEYVILRGFAELPEKIIGGDIDMYVKAEDFETAFDIAENTVPELRTRREPFLKQIRVALEDPWDSISRVLKHPRLISKHLVRREKHKNLSEGDYRVKVGKFVYGDSKSKYDNLTIDMWNHICYSSPLLHGKYRTDPKVGELMLKDRIKHNGFYVPSPPDELAHLIGRAVFYYNEDGLPEYYVERMDHLRKKVLDDQSFDDKFKTLLDLMFFAAGDRAYQVTEKGEFKDMREELEAFSDY